MNVCTLLDWIKSDHFGKGFPMKRADIHVTDTEPVRPAIITEKYSENIDLKRLLSQLQIQRVELETQSEQLQETIISLVEFQDAQANLVKNLEKSEQFKQSVIDSLPANIAIIDQDGVIVMVNRPWESFSEEDHMPDMPFVDLGINYLDVCRKAIVSDKEDHVYALKALEGIQNVLTGTCARFVMEYPCDSPSCKQWYQMTVSGLNKDFAGAVISHVDISGFKRLEYERSEYTKHLSNSIEDDRVRISRDLHDSIGQSLTLLTFDIVRIQREISTDQIQVHDLLTVMNVKIQDIGNKIQRICTNLRPSLLETLGLADSIEWICENFSRHSGIPCEIAWDGKPCKKPYCAVDIFRIVQEALNNIAKYAKAGNVTVSLVHSEAFFTITICDNGQGFDIKGVPIGRGFGLMGMRERAVALGGKLEIKSSSKGTAVTLKLTCGTGRCALNSIVEHNVPSGDVAR